MDGWRKCSRQGTRRGERGAACQGMSGHDNPVSKKAATLTNQSTQSLDHCGNRWVTTDI